MNSALMVADYIISRGDGRLNPLQVIKLTYISHGYTLALTGKPLIEDRIEAWKYGPVIPVLYHALKHYGWGNISQLYFCGTKFTDKNIDKRKNDLSEAMKTEEKVIMDRVMETYGSFTADQLSNLTHEDGTPWAECYVKGELFTEIPNSKIMKHYKELCDAVR